MTKAIEVKGLTKRYKELTALDDVSLSVNEGEVVGLTRETASHVLKKLELKKLLAKSRNTYVLYI